MNCKLPRLAETVRRLHTNPKGEQGRCTTIPRSRVGFVAAVIAVLVPAALLAQQPARQSSYGQSVNKEGRAGEGSAELPAPEEKDGNKLVAEAARQVFRQKAIEAKVRQRSYLFGQEVPGAGEYAQLGAGQQKFLRLEMKMQIGPQPATLLQVSGRQDLWIRRQVPPAPPRLEHVNLTRLRSALMRLDEEGKSIPADNWILFGGLSSRTTQEG